MKKEDQFKKVASVWSSKKNTSQRYGKGFHWVESPLVMENINILTTGKGNVSFLDFFITKYLKGKSNLNGLSLGCGTGKIERAVQKERVFSHIEGIDLAKGAIRQAEELAREENMPEIKYRIADLNHIKLKKNAYDIIFANSILHHVEKLEYLFKEINKTLKPNGLFYVNEYVGPSQFQYTKKQVNIINDILTLLPRKYRKRVTNQKLLKPLFEPPSKEYMNEHDPSEAIRSKEIVELLQSNFTVLEHKDFGGTLLHMLLQDIVGNFDIKDEKDVTSLKLLCYLEKILIKEGVLSSDFTYMVLAKKNSRN